MILARLADALRRQEWTTFFIEFVLVIAGVLIALEVDNWNQARIDEREFFRELALLRTELDENRKRLGYTIGNLETELTELSAFQRAFHADPPGLDEAKMGAVMEHLWRQGGGLFVRSASVERVLGSEGILGESYERLRKRLEVWSLVFAGYTDAAGDYERYRDGVVLPLFTESYSPMLVAERWFRDTAYFPKGGEMDAEIGRVFADVRVEHAVLNKMLHAQDVLEHAQRIDQISARVIAEIERVLAGEPPETPEAVPERASEEVPAEESGS